MIRFRMLALAPLAALALSACGGTDETALPAGEPVAEVPAPEGSNWRETVQLTDRGGYLVGNPDAPIKLVEYGSLTCPGCAAFSRTAVEPLLNDYVGSGRVSFEFRSFIIHGPLDLVLTRLISCGPKESAVPLAEQIWSNLAEIQQKAYADQNALEATLQLPEEQRFVAFAQQAQLYDFFAARGISRDQAATCLADFGEMKRLADLSQSYASEDGINSTPSFVLNGATVTDGSWDALEAALQRAGAR